MGAPETVAAVPRAPVSQHRPLAARWRAAIGAPELAVAALTTIGAVLRVIVAHQSVFADELSTYWISVDHSLGGVLSLLYSSGRIQHAEITPPLSFLAAWLSTRLGSAPELLRLPALLAGTATIPLVYLLGRRSVGRPAALLAAGLTTFSPFMIYYSAEARAYGLLMFFLVCAVLSLLLALDTGRTRFWVLYAVLSAAAFYTHYTCVFVLAVALAWVLWAHPRARRPALLANGAAALLVLPWIPGLIAGIQSPTVKILSALSPFTASAVRVDLQHWALGYPYTTAGGLDQLPGVPALVLLALGLVLAGVGVASRAHAAGWRPSLQRRVVLIALLMLATPVGEAVGSTTGNHIIGVRDLAASWPFLALFGAWVAFAAGRRLGAVVAALALVAFALGAARMLEARFARPDYQGAANFVAAHARAGEVVIDETGALSPGPLTGLDVAFHRSLVVLRARSPAERDHPFTVFDPIASIQSAVSRAVGLAAGRRVFVVRPVLVIPGRPSPPPRFPPSYRLSAQHSYPGITKTLVDVYSPVR